MATSNSTTNLTQEPVQSNIAYKSRGGIIYLLTNTVNGMQYVGKTVSTLKTRWTQHVSSAKRRNTYIANAILKYGAQSFTIELLEQVDDHATLLIHEQEWIVKLNTIAPSGYNLTRGGEGAVGLTPSPESIAKRVAKVIGRSPSQETREKISAAQKGRPGNKNPKSAETRARMSAAAKGKAKSPEHCRKLSEAQKGIPKGTPSAEHRANLSKALKGKTYPSRRGIPLSDETKRKLSEAKLGHAVSDETREKLRQAAKQQWERQWEAKRLKEAS